MYWTRIVSTVIRMLEASNDRAAAEAVARRPQRPGFHRRDRRAFTLGTGRNLRGSGWLRVIVDETANAKNAGIISTADSRIEVRVIPTDEEAMIAGHRMEVMH